MYHYFEQISTVILAWCSIAVVGYCVYFGICSVTRLLASAMESAGRIRASRNARQILRFYGVYYCPYLQCVT